MQRCNPVYASLHKESGKLVNRAEYYYTELLVVRQYFVVVCQRCREWLAGYERSITAEEFHKGIEDADGAIREIYEILKQRLPARTLLPNAAPERARECIPKTIFHPVIAALSSRYDWKTEFRKYVESYEPGHDWLNATKLFRPRAFTIDASTNSAVVGATFARWKKLKSFEDWEKAARDAALTVPTRQLFAQARSALGPVVEAKLSKKAGIAGGISAIEREGLRKVFAQHCEGRQWLSLNLDLQHLDPCATCQVLFCDVELIQPKADEPNKPIGDGWDEGRGWQCAEADVFAQIAANQIESLLDECGKQNTGKIEFAEQLVSATSPQAKRRRLACANGG